MHAIALWMALAAAPFWETKAPPDWTIEQLRMLVTDSPWAQGLESGGAAVLASAKPIRDAERELERRGRPKSAGPADPEFADFMGQDQGRHIVLAISYANPNPLADATESRKMEEESVLKVGRKKFKMTGHFPPTPSDPYLRLVYPREIGASDKSLVFDLYVPGVAATYVTVEFRFKELVYRGKPEM